MELVWRCLNCGEQWPDRGQPLPETCPGCGGPKLDFQLLSED